MHVTSESVFVFTNDLVKASSYQSLIETRLMLSRKIIRVFMLQSKLWGAIFVN